jgi:hypothetical protein
VISDPFPFRPTRVESTENVEEFRIARMENVINPCAVIEFVTSCDERYAKEVREKTGTVNEETVLTPGFNGTLAPSVRG